MSTVAVVQARVGSTRLPGKVLRDLGGATVLARVVRRVRRARRLDAVVVATTERSADDPLVAECEGLGVDVFRGSEDDVLARFCGAARAAGAEVVVRITADCPLIDPGVIDQVVAAFVAAAPDYASNTLVRTFPRGLDVEVMTRASLERAAREATEAYQRVHVTPYLYQHPELFRLLPVTGEVDASHLRWTVDTAEDLALVRALYARLDNDDAFDWRRALRVVEDAPELADLNRGVQQKRLEEG